MKLGNGMKKTHKFFDKTSDSEHVGRPKKKPQQKKSRPKTEFGPLPIKFYFMNETKECFKGTSVKAFENYCKDNGLHGFFRTVGPTIGDSINLIPLDVPGKNQLESDYNYIMYKIIGKSGARHEEIIRDLTSFFADKPYLKYCIVEHTVFKEFKALCPTAEQVNNPSTRSFATHQYYNSLYCFIQAGAEYKDMLTTAWTNNKLEEFSGAVRELKKTGMDILNMPQPLLDPRFDNSLSQLLTMFSIGNSTRDWMEESYLKLERLIKIGLDVNRKEHKKGTFLHRKIANEADMLVSKLMDFFEKNNCTFDYTATDNFQGCGNKTVLLMSVLWNQIKSFNKLLAMHNKKGRKIGLNIRDSFGVSPLYYAAALGRWEMVEQLLEAGASCNFKDKKGRSFEHYLNCDEDLVKKILTGIAVEPDRTEGLHHNWLYSDNDIMSPLVISDTKNNDEYGRILLSHKRQHMRLLEKVQDTIEKKKKLLMKNLKVNVYLNIKKELAKKLQLNEPIHFWLLEAGVKSHVRVRNKNASPVVLVNNSLKKLRELSDKNRKVKECERLDNLSFRVETSIKQVRTNKKAGTVLEVCLKGKEKVISIYQKHKKKLQQRLRTACALGNLEQVKDFVENHNVDINAKDKFARTPLHYCIFKFDTVKGLLKKKKLGHTPQEVQQTRLRNLEIFEYLLRRSADTTIKCMTRSGMSQLTVPETIKAVKDSTTDKAADKDFARQLYLCYESVKKGATQTEGESSFNVPRVSP